VIFVPEFKQGAIGGMLGVNGGANGTGYGGPSVLPSDPTGMTDLATTFSSLKGVADGTGPDPAMAQYNQNVQNNAKQQSGAISSIQGISPALAARMASQQGSAALQNSAAQGASTQAQQQLGAMGQMAGVAGSQAQIAAGMQQNSNNINGSLAQTNMQGQQGMIGGVMSGFGATSSMGGAMAAMARGGEVKRFADGGDTSDGPMSSFAQFLKGNATSVSSPSVAPMATPAAISGFSQGMGGYGAQKNGGGAKPAPQQQPMQNQGQGPTQQASDNMGAGIPYAQPMQMQPESTAIPYSQPTFSADFANGGSVPAMVSPGEQYLAPKDVKQVAKGKSPLSVGQRIPGTPRVAGNSYANDTVPKTLQAGGIVIPNNIMQSKDPARGAADFVNQVLAKRKGRK
jgi:hypothetical protein